MYVRSKAYVTFYAQLLLKTVSAVLQQNLLLLEACELRSNMMTIKFQD